MNTKLFLTLSLCFFLSLGAILPVKASASLNNPEEPFTSVKRFRRISVIGNVEITLIQAEHSGICYSKDNEGAVQVSLQGDQLNIRQKGKERPKVTIYLEDLYRISASEGAEVKTAGNLKTDFLQVFLKGNSIADICSETKSLYTVIEDKSELKLSGSTAEHNLIMGNTQKLTMERFSAQKTTVGIPVANG